jgi:hypothetical protein
MLDADMRAYLNVTTTTSSSSANIAPLYAGEFEVPVVKPSIISVNKRAKKKMGALFEKKVLPPPYIHSITAFFGSPTCGLVQTLMLRQSSENVWLEASVPREYL